MHTSVFSSAFSSVNSALGMFTAELKRPPSERGFAYCQGMPDMVCDELTLAAEGQGMLSVMHAPIGELRNALHALWRFGRTAPQLQPINGAASKREYALASIDDGTIARALRAFEGIRSATGVTVDSLMSQVATGALAKPLGRGGKAKRSNARLKKAPRIQPTPRELRVSELVSRGFSNRQIADELGVSEPRVTQIRKSIAKLASGPSRSAPLKSNKLHADLIES